jgi:hypothetical protein
MGGFQSRRPPRSFQGGPDDDGPPAKMPASNFNRVCFRHFNNLSNKAMGNKCRIIFFGGSEVII